MTTMKYMIAQAGPSTFNQPLDFDSSNVKNMMGMFFKASRFNQPLDFDTSSVTTMVNMFYSASSFNQPLDFNTSSVTNMEYMFWRASILITHWTLILPV
jgi:surface protein